MTTQGTMERNLALEVVRVTEAAALSASLLMGRGDEKAADQAAVDAMRAALNSVMIDGTVVIGESVNFTADLDWLRGAGIDIIDLSDPDCIAMMRDFIAARPDLWLEDIGD